MRILVVEDDPALLQILEAGFRENRVDVVTARTFHEGREKAALGTYAVVILDVGLPGGSGFDLCKRIRSNGISTPVLMLTARDAVDDRVYGLESGADDYLTKPFAFKELLARVQALARRPPQLAPEKRSVADLEVDLRTRDVRRAGRAIQLTAKEFELLEFFLRHEGVVVDRAAITAAVLGRKS